MSRSGENSASKRMHSGNMLDVFIPATDGSASPGLQIFIFVVLPYVWTEAGGNGAWAFEGCGVTPT